MIQRIQTVYLLLAVVAMVICLCSPVAAYIGPDGSLSPFTNLGVDIAGAERDTSCWGLFVILLLAAIVATATIFLYKNRILQIRMTVFNLILLAGYYATFAAFAIAYGKSLPATSLHLRIPICLPFVAMVLDYLAVRAIGKDEIMVRAADRLR